MPGLVHGAVPTPDVVGFPSEFATLHHQLHPPGPLGDVHVAGPADPAPLALTALADRGFSALPPQSEPFPAAAHLRPPNERPS
jgi:hypothetical protein